MEKELFNYKIKAIDIKRWDCPYCQKGRLLLNEKEVITIDLAHTLPKGLIGSHDEYIYLRILGSLKCDYCDQSIEFISYLEKTTNVYQIGKNDYVEEKNEFYYPSFFEPALHPIKLNKYLPEEIRKEIIKSFSLLWVDEKACANKIRSILELIMNQQRIRKGFRTRNGNWKKYNLHQRIVLFANKKKDISEYIMALKHIGNAGSHGSKLNRDIILEAYEFLEYVLNNLYDKKYEILRKKMIQINKRKKP
ncbi:MAG: DUF4145 domain-containing protein [Candidatus Tenebribacter davisii]|nr:DUF4145 domain-containing protein [Candidatus Tenebribacter davisii]